MSKKAKKNQEKKEKKYIFIGKTDFYKSYFLRKNSVYDEKIVNSIPEIKQFFKEL